VRGKICPCCCREMESRLHPLWNCPTIQDVWGGGSVIFQKSAFLGDTLMQLVEFCLDRLNTEDMGLMDVVSHKIWLRRNKLIFESIFTHPQVVFNEAVASIEEYHRYNRCEDEQVNINGVPSSTRPSMSWKPPPLGFIKVNWDALVNAKKKYIEIGIVARDNNSNFLGARAVTKSVVVTPKVAEAMAALEAVLFSKAASFFEVILEGDAKQVVDDVNYVTLNLNTAGHFVEGIKAELQGLRYASMVHVGREANNDAHCLA
jgi:hypothetical protein